MIQGVSGGIPRFPGCSMRVSLFQGVSKDLRWVSGEFRVSEGF